MSSDAGLGPHVLTYSSILVLAQLAGFPTGGHHSDDEDDEILVNGVPATSAHHLAATKVGRLALAIVLCACEIQPALTPPLPPSQIQAKAKGYMGKKKFQKKKKAAITIQSSYRGHQARKAIKEDKKKKKKEAEEKKKEDAGSGSAGGYFVPTSHPTGPATPHTPLPVVHPTPGQAPAEPSSGPSTAPASTPAATPASHGDDQPDADEEAPGAHTTADDTAEDGDAAQKKNVAEVSSSLV